MLVVVQPTFQKERFSVDVPYNTTVENFLVQCSLHVTDVPISEMGLYFNSRNISVSTTLDKAGVTEGAVVELRQREASSCCLLL